jgi:hypothetical protein
MFVCAYYCTGRLEAVRHRFSWSVENYRLVKYIRALSQQATPDGTPEP